MTTSEGRAETPEPDGTTLKPLDPNDPIDRVRLNASARRAKVAHRPARHVDTPDEALALSLIHI